MKVKTTILVAGEAAFAAALVFGAATVLLLPTPAWPHQATPTAAQPQGWAYPWACCSGNDCAHIAAHHVETKADGYHVSVAPGEHQMVKQAVTFVIPYGDQKIRMSPDGEYHLCLRQGGTSAALSRVICFFAPPPGA